MTHDSCQSPHCLRETTHWLSHRECQCHGSRLPLLGTPLDTRGICDCSAAGGRPGGPASTHGHATETSPSAPRLCLTERISETGLSWPLVCIDDSRCSVLTYEVMTHDFCQYLKKKAQTILLCSFLSGIGVLTRQTEGQQALLEQKHHQPARPAGAASTTQAATVVLHVCHIIADLAAVPVVR